VEANFTSAFLHSRGRTLAQRIRERTAAYRYQQGTVLSVAEERSWRSRTFLRLRSLRVAGDTACTNYPKRAWERRRG